MFLQRLKENLRRRDASEAVQGHIVIQMPADQWCGNRSVASLGCEIAPHTTIVRSDHTPSLIDQRIGAEQFKRQQDQS